MDKVPIIVEKFAKMQPILTNVKCKKSNCKAVTKLK